MPAYQGKVQKTYNNKNIYTGKLPMQYITLCTFSAFQGMLALINPI